MYLTGFADEASRDIRDQIKATRDLGWNHIESRRAGSANIHEIPDEEFERVAAVIEEAGIRINCFGSTIMNWGQQITDPFEKTLQQVRQAIPRMKRLHCDMIRVMSYAVLKDKGPEEQMEQERFRRIAEVTRMFLDEGIQPVHENCMNYGGMGWPYTLRLIENCPGLKLVFDTCNPVFSDDRSKPEPWPKQDSWEFYKNVKEHVAYLHIKDGYLGEDGKTVFTHAGEGHGHVKEIVKDLLDSGYDGGISMEPHLAVVFHDETVQAEEEVRYSNYVEYGRRFMTLLEDIGHGETLRQAGYSA
jgi:sugar phosphate isomerase/epimerase